MKNSLARTQGAPAPRTPSTLSVLLTAKGSEEKTRDAHRTARKTLSTSGVQSTANNSKARIQGVVQTALSTHSIRSVPLTVLRVKTLVATAIPVIPPVRAQRTFRSQLFQIQARPLESRSQEDQKPSLALSKTREQWLNQVQGCPTGTTHSTASTMIKEMGGVGGMG